MFDDLDDKTEAPTPQRRREARERGQVARTQDLAAATLLLGAMLLLKGFGPGLLAALQAAMAEALGPESMASVEAAAVGRESKRAVAAAASALAPVLAGLVMIAVAANVAQVGFVFNASRLRQGGVFKPFRGAGRRLRPGQVALSAVKLAAVVFAGYWAVRGRLGEIVSLQRMELPQAVGAGASIVFSAGLWVGAAMLGLALADYAYQRWRLERELRMTRQEVKDELRASEGDPAMKKRRRETALAARRERVGSHGR